MSYLEKILICSKRFYFFIRKKAGKNFNIVKNYFSSYVNKTSNKCGFDLMESNQFIAYKLFRNEPFFACKIGKNERDWLRIIINPGNILNQITNFKIRTWDSNLKGKNPAGIFPFNYIQVLIFARRYFSSIKKADLICQWWNKEDEFIVKNLDPSVTHLSNTFDVFNIFELITYGIKVEDTWLYKIKGKILLITPFEKSIKNSLFEHREFFSVFNGLCDRLVFLKPPTNFNNLNQSDCSNNWELELENMQFKLNDFDFDVALVGAGCYSIFLCEYIKLKLNKPAIHLGGVLHFNFGITGGRWIKTQPLRSLNQKRILGNEPSRLLDSEIPKKNQQKKINLSDAYW